MVARRRACARDGSFLQDILGRKVRALDRSSSASRRQRWVAAASCAMSAAAPAHNHQDDSVVDVTAAFGAAAAAACHRELRPTTCYADRDTTATVTNNSQPRWRQKFRQDARPRGFHLLQQQPPPLLPASNGGVRCLSSRGGKGKGGRTRGSPTPNSNNNSSSSSSSSSSGGSSAGEAAEPVITLNGVSKQLPGGRELFGDASLTFVRGAKVGVLGVNGSGKSTVLKILAGEG